MGKKAEFVRKDRFYDKAKEDGFASRASYKLIELNKSFGLIKPGYKIMDLGAWPGGWLQVAWEAVGRGGRIVGIDLKSVTGISGENIQTLVGDVCDDEVIAKALSFLEGQPDCVISDMSPQLTGIKEADRAAASSCAELALSVASRVLKPGGGFVCKLFKSNEAEEFVKVARSSFNKIHRVELDSTRKSSNEFYLVGLGFKKIE